MSHPVTPGIESFIARWKASGASERANYQLFLTELCELLGVEKPRPASDKVHEADYSFERPVVFDDEEGRTSTNFIDLYQRLVTLNRERAAEEARGLVRWLRPEYQNPQGVQQTGIAIEVQEEATKAPDGELAPWPKSRAEQAQAVQRALQLQDRPVTADDLYRHFKPVLKGQLAERLQQIDSLLQTLQGLGLLRRTEGGQYVK